MSKKKIGKYFKRGAIGYRLSILTIVYVILAISFLTPFMTIEGANTTLGIIIVIVLSTIYVFIVLLAIWDEIKKASDK